MSAFIKTHKAKFITYCLLFLTLLAVISSAIVISGVNAYTPKEGNTISVTFAEGTAGSTAVSTSFFTAGDSASLTVNSSKCIILPDGTEEKPLSNITTNNSLYSNVDRDNESFIFDSSNWTYTFTGWHIVGAAKRVPGTTVFQPGDVITPDVLETYVSADGKLQLEALWGKCYFIRNPYDQMALSYINRYNKPYPNSGTRPSNHVVVKWYYLDASASAAKSGVAITDNKSSDSFTGKYPTKWSNDGPMATLDGLYAKLRAEYDNNADAFSVVVMLTGDLDYFKDTDLDTGYYGYRSDSYDFLSAAANTALAEYKNTETVVSTAAQESALGFWGGTYSGVNDSNVEYVSATYKSLDTSNNGTVYNFNYKPQSNFCQIYGNIRFDNVNMLLYPAGDGYTSAYNSNNNLFGEKVGHEFVMYYGNHHASFDHYFEFTHRMNQSVPSGRKIQASTVRPNKFETCVVNGGGEIDSIHNSYGWNYPDFVDRVWRFGRNCHFDYLYGGNQSNNQFELTEVNGNYTYYITGGYTGSVYGGFVNQYSIGIGHRNIYVLGDDNQVTAGSDYYPHVWGLWGGGYSAPQYGNINIYLNNAYVQKSVYGGGRNSTATVYGSINVDINNSLIAENVFGGGEFGNTELLDSTTYTRYKYQYIDVNGKPTTNYHGAAAAGAAANAEQVAVEYEFDLEGTNTLTDRDGTLGNEAGANVPLTHLANIKNEITANGGNVVVDIDGSTVKGNVYGSGSGSTNTVATTNMSYLTGKWIDATWTAATSLSHGTFIKTGDRYIKLFDFSQFVVDGSYIYNTDRTKRWAISSVKKMSDYTWIGNGQVKDGSGNTYTLWTLDSGKGKWDTTSITDFINTPSSGFPAYEASTSAIITRKYKYHGWNIESTNLSYPEYIVRAFLSVATVQNTDIRINNSTTNNIYGGGNLAKVLGDTNITVTGASVTGSIYGGGDGSVSSLAKVMLYKEYDAENLVYSPIDYDVIEYELNGRSKRAVWPAQDVNSANQEANVYGEFTWTDRADVLAAGGIDYENKLIYSPEVSQLGYVGGSTHVEVDNRGGRSFNIYGAGYQGRVNHDTNVHLASGIIGNSTYTDGHVYGGGNNGSVGGNVNVEVTGGYITQSLYGGSQRADIGGNVTVNVNHTPTEDFDIIPNEENVKETCWDAYGGNHTSGNIAGQITLNWHNGRVYNIFGGCYITPYSGTPHLNFGCFDDTTYAESTNVLCGGGNGVGSHCNGAITYIGKKESATVKAKSVYGGGNNSDAYDDVYLDITHADISDKVFGAGCNGKVTGSAETHFRDGAKVSGWLVGGGYKGAVDGKTSLYMYSGSHAGSDVYVGGQEANVGSTYFWAEDGVYVNTWLHGGGRSGSVTGKCELVINGGEYYNWVIGGSQSASVGSVDMTINGGEFSTGIKSRGIICGGKSGDVLGDINVVINGGVHRDIIAGCDQNTVHGDINLTLNGGTFATDSDGNSIFYGGCNENGTVKGDVNLDINHSGGVDAIYGGGFGANVTTEGDITLDINCDDATEIPEVYGGGESATVTNTTVNMKKGTVTNLYGGGKRGNVAGNVTVNADGGNVINNVYGGCNVSGTVTGTVTVNANNSLSAKAFYGGGKGAGAITTGDTTVNVKNTDATEIPAVYGGGDAAQVANVNVNMTTGKVKNIYGGGNKGIATGDVHFEMSDGTVSGFTYCGANQGDIYGNIYGTLSGGTRQKYVFGGSRAANVGQEGNGKGNIEFTISGGVNERHTFGGNNASGIIYGNVTVTTTGGTYGQIHGGSNGDEWDDDGIVDKGAVIKGDVEFNINGGSCTAQYYGGDNMMGNTEGEIVVNVNAATESTVFGGGYGVKEYTTATVNVNADGVVGHHLYGAGNTAASHVDNTVLNIYGKVTNAVYGGGNKGTAGNTTVNYYGTFPATAKDCVYGGGNQGDVTGNSTVNLYETAVINKNVFGGGNLGDVIGTATVNTYAGSVAKDNLFCGGNEADVGATALNVMGGTLGSGAPSRIAAGDFVCGGGLNGDVLGNSLVNITGGKFNSYLYGGGKNGSVLGNIELNLNVPASDATSSRNQVYGGCHEANVGQEGVAGTGDITLNLYDNGRSTQLLFGGNNLGGTIYGDVNYNIYGRHNGNSYGGSNGNLDGCEGKYTANTIPGAVIKGDINVYFGENGYSNGNIYCGNNEKGICEGTIYCVLDGEAGNGVFGGGYGSLAPHFGETNVTIGETGRVTNHVRGGGNLGYVEYTEVHVYGTVGGSVFGGGYSATSYVSNANVYMLGGLVKGNVFGGGDLGSAGTTTVNTVAGTVNGYVYGGCNVGSTDNATVTIHGGTFKKDINGGGKNGTVREAAVYITDTGATPLVNENPIITIEGNVYGGGEGATATVFENATVEIDMNYDFDVVESEVTLDKVDVQSGQSQITITGTAGQSVIKGSVYGGGDLGAVGEGSILNGVNKANITREGSTHVTVIDGLINGSVFGGGRGIPANNVEYKLSMGAVYGSTLVDIYGGHIETNVYGGGEQSRVYSKEDTLASQVNLDCNVHSYNKIAVCGSIFGGGDRGSGTSLNASVPTTVGDVEVNIIGNPNGTPIYIRTGGVYGDGNLCLVSGNRTINMKDFVTGTNYLKTFRSVQRADTVNLDNTEVVLLGAVDLVEEGDETLYSINRVGQLNMKNGSTVKLDSIVKYLGGMNSDVDTDRPFLDKGNSGPVSAGKNNYTGHGGSASNVNILNSQDALETENYIRSDVNEVQHGLHNIICVANGLYIDVIKADGTYGPVNGLFTLQLLHAIPGVGGGFVYGDITTSTGDFICTTAMDDNSNLTDVNVVDGVTYMTVIDDVGKLPASSTYDYYYWYINGGTMNYDTHVTGLIGTDVTEFSSTSTIPVYNGEHRYILENITGLDTLKAYITDGTHSLVQTKNVTGQQIALEFRISGTSIGFVEYNASTDTWSLNSKTGLDGIKEGNADYADQLDVNLLFTGALPAGQNYIECVLHKSADIAQETTEPFEAKLEIKVFGRDSNSPPSNLPHIFNINASYSIKRIDPTQQVYYENIRNYVGLTTQNPINITKESAFTVEYQTRYIPKAFNSNSDTMDWYFNTSNKFPANTKISLVDMSGNVPTYYYYICSGNETQIDLENFMQMGTETKISALPDDSKPAFIKQYVAQTTDIVTERLLFVVDFHDVTNYTWSSNKYTGNVSLTHYYGSHEFMDYDDSEGLGEAPYNVYQNEVGMESFSAAFAADSYPDKGTPVLNVTLTENDVVDTRYYENEFAIKLELIDNDTGNVVEMPNGITFIVDGETYYVGADNLHAVVPVTSYGTHSITIDNSISGVQTQLGGDTTIKFKATVYSAPEASYHNSISTGKNAQDTYTIANAVSHSLSVVVPYNPADKNLILARGENLTFNLRTLQQYDPDTTVSVEAYKNVDGEYIQRVPLSTLFTNSTEILQTAETAPVAHSWTVGYAESGVYRLVFTYAERTEYLYFIVD